MLWLAGLLGLAAVGGIVMATDVDGDAEPRDPDAPDDAAEPPEPPAPVVPLDTLLPQSAAAQDSVDPAGASVDGIRVCRGCLRNSPWLTR